MQILVLNSGSSSIKFKYFKGQSPLASGLVEKIGEADSRAELKLLAHPSSQSPDPVAAPREFIREGEIKDHEQGLAVVSALLREAGILEDLSELDACAHRIVHGGPTLTQPCVVDEAVRAQIERVSIFAPLHNPANLAGILTLAKLAPAVPNVAVFDTAFHRSLPPEAYTYALPRELCEKYQLRKYGFHGTSHQFLSERAGEILGLSNINCINAHLGNGASLCAVREGRSVDTSMGFTPLEGLVMGTRCGDIDPAILPFLGKNEGLDLAQLDELMNKKSGLAGLASHSDLRDLKAAIAQGDAAAALAYELFAYRILKYIGAYLAVLPHTDALIFAGGIGENDATLRLKICSRLAHLGLLIDEAENEKRSKTHRLISRPESKIKILIIPTDEELKIAQLAEELIGG